MAVESILRAMVDTPVLEIEMELLLRFPVPRVEFVQVVVCDVERMDVLSGLYDGTVQQTTTHEVHQTVQIHSLAVFRK